MLRNTRSRPMEYASSLGYYNYQYNNVEQYNHQPNVAYNPVAGNAQFQDAGNTSFYQSVKQYDEKISEFAGEPAPDFNANVAAHNVTKASPPAYSANAIKPALPTFPWMNYSSEDGKRKRQSYTRRQTLELEKEFCYSQYLTKKRRSELCQLLQLSEKQIKTWFQNRRMKKKKEKEKHIDIPKLDDVEIPTFVEKADSQDYVWDKSATSSPTVTAESYKVDHSTQFVPDTSHFYYNNPYEANYT